MAAAVPSHARRENRPGDTARTRAADNRGSCALPFVLLLLFCSALTDLSYCQLLTLQRFKLMLDDLRNAQEESVAELRLVHHEVPQQITC